MAVGYLIITDFIGVIAALQGRQRVISELEGG